MSYKFNAFGLRDREPSAIPGSEGPIAVLGDSVAKGLFLPASDTVSAQLEKLTKRPFLNGAIRFSSPTTQSLHFARDIEPHYPVRGVLWLLNGSDPTDERFYRSRSEKEDEHGVPVRFVNQPGDPFAPDGDSWLAKAQKYSKAVSLAVRARTFWRLRQSISGVPPTRENLCGGIERLAGHLKKTGTPLLIVFTPHYHEGLVGNWMGERYDPAELALMASCARDTGAKVLDLTGEELRKEWFFEDLIHYRPEGTAWLAERLEPELKTMDRRKSKAPGSKPGS